MTETSREPRCNECLCPFAGEDDSCPCASGEHERCPRCPDVDRTVYPRSASLGDTETVTVPRALLTELTRATGYYVLATRQPPCGFKITLDRDAAYERLVAARRSLAAALPPREDER